MRIAELLLAGQPEVYRKLRRFSAPSRRTVEPRPVFEAFVQMLAWDRKFVRCVRIGAMDGAFAAAAKLAREVGFRPRSMAAVVRQAAAIVQGREVKAC